jgi:hypothetical protein
MAIAGESRAIGDPMVPAKYTNPARAHDIFFCIVKKFRYLPDFEIWQNA